MSDLDKIRKKIEERQEELEEIREETSFEECVAIKEAGELYRELGSIEDVAEDLDVSEEVVEQRVRQYITLVSEPTNELNARKLVSGVQFYGGQESLQELTEGSERDLDEIQDGIREFVSLTLAESGPFQGIISVENIPKNPVYPQSLTDAVKGFTETVAEVSTTVSAIELPWKETLADIRLMQERIDRTLTAGLQPALSQFAEFAREFREQVQIAIRDGISNFEPPEDYDSERVHVNPMARKMAITSLEGFIEEIENADSEELNSYLPRLQAIIAGFEEKNYFTPIFVAISVQDGMMQYICEQDGVSPDDTSRFGDDIYKWETKRDTLARKYEGWYDIETDEVIPNLDSFYQHRNTIVHGDPLAFFDENIATISLLFLNLTIYTVIETLED